MDLHVKINISIVTNAEGSSLGDGHQTKGLKRDVVDKFYTKSAIVKECCLNIQKFLNVGKSTDIIIEPSAGNGAFMECINSMCDKTYFYDLKPDNINITQQDFLKLDYTKFYRDTESITWTNDDDLYGHGGNSHKKEQSNRILNRETLILKEIKESEKLFSQCEVVKSFKLLKKKMKEASSSLLRAQLKTNEEIKKAIKNRSDRNQKTEKQQL